MRYLDSCRYWRCTLCPCKVRNKVIVNFWNHTILLCILCITCSLGTGNSWHGSKAAGAWGWLVTPSLLRLKMSGAILPLILYVFMARKGKTIPLLHFITFWIVIHLVLLQRQGFDTCNSFHHQTRSFLLSRATLSKPLTVSLESVSSTHWLYNRPNVW